MEKSLYRVTDAAPARVDGKRSAPGDLLRAYPEAVSYEVDLGHLVETTIEAEYRPVEGLTDAERASLPALIPEGDGRAELAVGRMHTAPGADTPMVEVQAGPDGRAEFVGASAEPAPEA